MGAAPGGLTFALGPEPVLPVGHLPPVPGAAVVQVIVAPPASLGGRQGLSGNGDSGTFPGDIELLLLLAAALPLRRLLCRLLPVGSSLLGPAAAYEGVDLLVQEPVGPGCILGIVVPFVDRLVPQHPDGVECVPGALGNIVSLIELLDGVRKIRIYDEILSCRETDDLFHRLPALHQSQVVLSPADKVRHVGQAPLHALPCTRVSDISHSNLLPVYGEVNHT